MNIVQKLALYGLIILSMALVLGACPALDSASPTEAIQIINIPKDIANKATSDAISEYSDQLNYDYSQPRSTFKVYVQLSAGMTASAGYAALGDALISDAEPTGDTYTITITNLKDQNGNPFKSSNWAFECVVISPKNVDTIWDIDARVGTKGPSLSPTVVFDWNNMSSKKLMKITDYEKLYGIEDSQADWGVIVKDDEISAGTTGVKKYPPDFPAPTQTETPWRFFN